MKPTLCSTKHGTCYPICDFCKHYDFNGEEYPDGAIVYVGKGYCNKHNKQSDPDDGCNHYVCFRIKDD